MKKQFIKEGKEAEDFESMCRQVSGAGLCADHSPKKDNKLEMSPGDKRKAKMGDHDQA